MQKIIIFAAVVFSAQTFAVKQKFVGCEYYSNPAIMWKDPNPPVDWANDFSVGESLKDMSDAAGLRSFYDEQLRTRIYFSGTGLANSKGEIPVVDPHAKGLFIWIHGNGTMNSSGAKYMAQFADFARVGVASLSMDLPYHTDGPQEWRLTDPKYFNRWLDQIIRKYRRPGMKVGLAGHSIGPDLIFEYVTRYPGVVDAVLALSPAPNDQVLGDWYRRFTANMHFGGNVTESSTGSIWGGEVTSRLWWNRTAGFLDPTIADPNLKMIIVSGDREEYVPAPLGPNGLPNGPNTYDIRESLQPHLKNAKIVILPGVGHYLFDYKDETGTNAILRYGLEAMGLSYKDIPELVKDAQPVMTLSESLRRRYATDSVFRAWADLAYGGRLLKLLERDDDIVARQVILLAQLQGTEREKLLMDRILATAQTDPEFYDRYRSSLEGKRDLHAVVFPWVEMLRDKQNSHPDFMIEDHSADVIDGILSITPKNKNGSNGNNGTTGQ